MFAVPGDEAELVGIEGFARGGNDVRMRHRNMVKAGVFQAWIFSVRYILWCVEPMSGEVLFDARRDLESRGCLRESGKHEKRAQNTAEITDGNTKIQIARQSISEHIIPP